MKTKVFITMYNRLTFGKNLAEFLADTGCEPIFIDNNSTYQPLLDWYKTCPFKVHMSKTNNRERAFWDTGLFEIYNDEWYVVTDHDLDLTGIPNDYIDVLKNGLAGNANVTKCGLSLKIDDLPENTYTKEVKNFETKYWTEKDTNGYWIAGVDTTFAIYNRARQIKGWDYGDNFYYAVRSDSPYTARHLPWYMDANTLNENAEELYYHQHCNNQWSRVYKREFNINL
jgi:hypothetical protein